MKLNISITLISTLLLITVAGSFAWELQQGRLMTRWADEVDPANCLPEYPRPQMTRSDWMNLNGVWQMQQAAAGDSVPAGQTLSGDILVPFPVESAISGVMEHYDRLWYRRTFEVPAGWAGKRIRINFGAVDWESEVYINGTSAGVHRGGFDGFSYDITDLLNASGPQEIIVRVYDPTNSAGIAVGKQDLNPGGIWYTAVTGIWQTVWIEPVADIAISELKLVPDVDNSLLNVSGFTTADAANLTVEAIAYDNGIEAGRVSGAVREQMQMRLREPKLWSPDHPFLYDLTINLKRGETIIDSVGSYFGMRKISVGQVDGVTRILFNNEFVFQMGPLDQGWWPDGLYTAPTDAALKWDIEMTKAYGFNMSRKHVKVEPARWYYWCDKMGLIVWQDMPSIRASASAADHEQFEHELSEMMREFGNHPSISLWVVFNEGWGQYDTVRVTQDVMAADPSRIVTCASGWTDYEVGHVIDQHHYAPPGSPAPTATRAAVNGEYGGIGMVVNGHMWDPSSWGYTMVNTGEELAGLYSSYTAQLTSLKDNIGCSAAVYTQITDVEVEINGLITYDREVVKVEPAAIYAANRMYQHLYSDVLPTAETTVTTWRYTTSEPNMYWTEPDFNDSSWALGGAGFGTAETPGAIVNTTWDTSDIWMRKGFSSDITPEELERVVLRLNHDEDAEVYINGVLAASFTGYTTSYFTAAISEQARNAIVTGADNVLAVHCFQSAGGQYIDAGITIETIISNETDCGAAGFVTADLNRDCTVDIDDLKLLASRWFDCSEPEKTGCESNL
ncbi:MAG: glycoside hydrolase family 2 protein [Phycisphaerae bacterium]|jgi:hypothetical protein